MWRKTYKPEQIANLLRKIEAAQEARELRKWLAGLGIGTLYIELGSPWENGCRECFNGKPRDKCLNGEISCSLKKAKVVVEQWRVEYNTRRPYSALRYRLPVPAPIALWKHQDQFCSQEL